MTYKLHKPTVTAILNYIRKCRQVEIDDLKVSLSLSAYADAAASNSREEMLEEIDQGIQGMTSNRGTFATPKGADKPAPLDGETVETAVWLAEQMAEKETEDSESDLNIFSFRVAEAEAKAAALTEYAERLRGLAMVRGTAGGHLPPPEQPADPDPLEKIRSIQ